jgi:Flp pilus assembly protein TadD/ketosteroid isomerase-like protein
VEIFDRLNHLVIPPICGLMKRLKKPLAIPLMELPAISLGNKISAAKWLVMVLCASQIAYADDIEDANRMFKNGQYSQALDKVNGHLADKPKDAQARFLKGLIFTEQGRTMDAIKIFSALTEDYPELPEPYNNLAVLYASQGQYEKAKLALEMAIRTHPSYATAHENLGDIYAKMASQAYDRALQLDRSSTSTQTKLAMINDLFSDGARSNKESSASTHSNPVPGKTEATALTAVAEKSPVAAQPLPSAMVTIKPAPLVLSLAQTDQNKEVIKTVNAWAEAWSSRDANKYLSFYAADFKTPNNESRTDWEATRQERVTTPKSIQVSISNATVKFSDTDHAVVSFRQSYRASHRRASGKKTLLMVKSDGKWLIQEERAR